MRCMSDQVKQSALEERILVCFGDVKDAAEVVSLLKRNGFEAEACQSSATLAQEVAQGVGAVLIGGEVVCNDDLTPLSQSFAEQSGWSDLPLILASDSGDELEQILQTLNASRVVGSTLFISRPYAEADLVNSVEIALRSRRRQYSIRDLMEQREAILASIEDPFMLLDWQFRIRYVNERAAELVCRTPEELLAQVEWEVLPEMKGGLYHQAVLQAAEKREPRRIEYQEPATGRWYEKRIYPSRAGISVFATEITERKLAEEALRRSEEKFRLMVESAVEYAIFSMDSAGLITSWNKGAERLLGYSESEIVGQKMDIIFAPEDREAGIPQHEIDQVESEGEADDERWHLRKDGSRFFASGQVMPMVDEAGRPHGYVKILRDYTGRKRAETWLRALNETLEKRVEERTAEAEQRAAQLQMLAAELTEAEERERRRLAEMLHDHLQQILVAAKMQVGMLNQPGLGEAMRDGLKRVDNLLGRSIDASRSLTVELSPPILYDAGLGPALHWLARRMSEDHALEVKVEASDGLGPESENIRVFLFQAVRELLLNIVKHAEVKEAAVTLERVDGEVQVVVVDAGAGFDPETTTTQAVRSKGSGFGLFSIGERVRLLGGTIDVETSPGKGTRVFVRVPQRQPEPVAARERIPEELEAVEEKEEEILVSERRVRGGRIRILLADDHKILREGLAGLLREQPDFDVVSEASDGQMAVEMASETHPDIIIMDVSMPRLNGVEATRKIIEAMPEVKVIGLSMHAQEDMADAMRKAGAIGYVTKGAPSEILTAAIRNAAAAAPGAGSA